MRVLRRGSATRLGRVGLRVSTGVLATATVVGCWTFVGGAATVSAVRVEGPYRIVSTDCYFAAGACHARFQIVQAGEILSDRSDKYFHGKVNGDRVKVGERFPSGTSEDSWIAIGTTTDGGKTVRGDFYDGIGGSGTFTMTFISR